MMNEEMMKIVNESARRKKLCRNRTHPMADLALRPQEEKSMKNTCIRNKERYFLMY